MLFNSIKGLRWLADSGINRNSVEFTDFLGEFGRIGEPQPRMAKPFRALSERVRPACRDRWSRDGATKPGALAPTFCLRSLGIWFQEPPLQRRACRGMDSRAGPSTHARRNSPEVKCKRR